MSQRLVNPCLTTQNLKANLISYHKIRAMMAKIRLVTTRAVGRTGERQYTSNIATAYTIHKSNIIPKCSVQEREDLIFFQLKLQHGVMYSKIFFFWSFFTMHDYDYFLCFPFILAEQLSQYHLPLGTVLRLTHAKWNHSISHCEHQ